ncbi:DUF5906 domain-containing protein [Flavobacterium psychrophilum]|uniref:DNA primase family protein n=1 Tax=Flavobacterium psychrophilum TaxID=96345 RepID=UPI001C8F62E6|nr:DNA primase family protein [Flavobacterium psychrophilum]QZK99955.1 DUF5906 domain-containing protein [Flavobacterium psychrophilum]
MSIKIEKGVNLNDIDINPITVVKTEGIQKTNNNVGEPKIKFKTQIQKNIISNEIFKEVLDSTVPINFDELEYGINNENNQSDTSDTNGKHKLDDEEKIVIIIDNLLETIEQKGYGFGVENRYIFLYNKNYWQEYQPHLIKGFLMEMAIKSGFNDWKSRKKRFCDLLFNQFLLSATLPEVENSPDTIKINLKNGTYTIKNGQEGILTETNKEDYFKYQLQFDYNPNAKAPMFLKFLNEVLPDLESQKVIMEYLGYIFTKNLKLEKILTLYGSGSNGKSVVFEIITALLGDANVSFFSMEKICDESGYQRANLASKLLNYSNEIGRKIDVQMFKRIASGEPVEARLPFKEPIVVKNYCKFIINANKLPEVEHSDAFFRRQLIVNFSKKIEESVRDIYLSKKIIASELSGIFNEILKGMSRLVEQGDFTQSKLILDEMIKYRKDSNSVSLFLEEENWNISITHKIRLTDLFIYYQRYCVETGQKPFTRRNFSQRLRESNITVEPGTNNYTVVWVEKDISNEEKDPFNTFIKPDKNIVEEILNNSKNSDDEKHNN